MKNQSIFLDGVILDQLPTDLTKLNLEVQRSNGYSHDWTEVISLPPDLSNLANVYLTTQPLGRVFGSSIVSFS